MMRGTKSGIKSSDYRSAATDESSRIRSRTSQRLQSAGGILLPSPLKANRVSSALAGSTGASHHQQHNSSSHSGGSPKSGDEDHHLHRPKSPNSRAASGDLPVGHKRVTRSSTTTKRYFVFVFFSFITWDAFLEAFKTQNLFCSPLANGNKFTISRIINH